MNNKLKKRATTVLLSICMAAASVGTSIPVCAAETTADEAAVSEEATAEQEEVSKETENTDTGLTVDESFAEESIVEESDDGEPAGVEAALDGESAARIEEEPPVAEEEPQKETGEIADREEKRNETSDEQDETSDTSVTVEEALAEETDSADPGDTSTEAAETVEPPVIEESLEMTKESEALAAEVVDSGTCGTNAKWTLTGTGDSLTLTISGSGKMDNYDYAIGPWGKRKDVKTLVIEEGITSVGKYAFIELSGLQQVSLPDTLTVIKSFAFCECEALEEIRIPEGVTSIEYAAFSGCGSLTNVALPDSLRTFGSEVFDNCTSLREIILPDNLNTIGSYCFRGCSSLRELVLPDSVSSIGKWVFEDCSRLGKIVLPSTWTSIGESVFERCSGLKSIVIPANVTTIKSYAFSGCSSLKSISFPNGIKGIGYHAFEGCSSLQSVSLPNTMKTIAYGAFEGAGLTSIEIPNGVTSIGNGAFSDCVSLQSVTLPKGLTEIGYMAFDGCGELTRFIVDAENKTFSAKDGVLFSKDQKKLIICPGGITGVYVVPSGVKSIESYAFQNCKKLTGIEFPNSLEEIGEYMIIGCTGIKRITIPNKDTRIVEIGLVIDSDDIEYGNEDYDYDEPMLVHFHPDYVMYGPKGSKAETFAHRYDIEYVYICNTHTWNKNYTVDSKATCAAEGCESIHCSVCDAIKSGSIRAIPRTDHTYGEWTVAKEPTETERGIKERECSYCGAKEQTKIPALAPLPIEEQEISGIAERRYTGEARTLNIEITSDDELLTEGKDYTVSYKNNTNLGEATVIITGIGEYKGTVEKKFRIFLDTTSKVTCTNVASGIKVSWEKVLGATSYYVFRDDVLLFKTSALAVTDKEVKYNGGTKYVYKVLATAKGTGDSPKARTATMYRLMPVGIKSLTNPSAGKMTVTYDKSKGCYGYVVRYGLKKDMSDANVVTVKGENTLSRTFSGMKKGKTYYVQVRTYMLENGVRYYSGYCTTKTITIKK